MRLICLRWHHQSLLCDPFVFRSPSPQHTQYPQRNSISLLVSDYCSGDTQGSKWESLWFGQAGRCHPRYRWDVCWGCRPTTPHRASVNFFVQSMKTEISAAHTHRNFFSPLQNVCKVEHILGSLKKRVQRSILCKFCKEIKTKLFCVQIKMPVTSAKVLAHGSLTPPKHTGTLTCDETIMRFFCYRTVKLNDVLVA